MRTAGPSEAFRPSSVRASLGLLDQEYAARDIAVDESLVLRRPSPLIKPHQVQRQSPFQIRIAVKLDRTSIQGHVNVVDRATMGPGYGLDALVDEFIVILGTILPLAPRPANTDTALDIASYRLQMT